MSEPRKTPPRPAVAVIGGGPAGLTAAEHLARSGISVTVYDRMPSMGRKLLMAGRGGLNLTHSEPLDEFLARYGSARPFLSPHVEAFPPAMLRDWADGLGQATFVGSSGRIFPAALKASPLLRAWLARLAGDGVRMAPRREWRGWDAAGRLKFDGPDGPETAAPDATILALGGASWPKLGSNGVWAERLARKGIAVAALRPANCGFAVGWSETFAARFRGRPLKTVRLSFAGRSVRGEAMIAAYGIEGGAVYALSAALRDAIEETGAATVTIDLRPDLGEGQIARRLGKARKGESLSNTLRKAAGLDPVAANLVREAAAGPLPREPDALAALIKAAPLTLTAPQGLERAISTAGGVSFEALDERLMLRALPGTFAAGEMLDWEAPTGGYLLQAAFATGLAAAEGALAWLAQTRGTSVKPAPGPGSRR